jgi:hypothetical protein
MGHDGWGAEKPSGPASVITAAPTLAPWSQPPIEGSARPCDRLAWHHPAASAGLDLATLAGAAVVVVCAMVTFVGLRDATVGRPSSTAVPGPRHRDAVARG